MDKRKLIEALDCTLGDVSEDRLVDLLLDAYAAAKKRNLELAAENASERDQLHHERENLMRELHKMRQDPLYCAHGRYYFWNDHRRYIIDVQGAQIQMVERREGVDYVVRQMSPAEWESQFQPTK